ncbi:MAG: hypothetical protein ISP91_04520 [Pseudomonadales bacterium]|nr:hypothetical protein [Pseudomonadales bacterium]
MTDSIICTLFENDYHAGFGALVNSLVKAGFSGTFVAGYRGTLPDWIHERLTGNPNEFSVDTVSVHLEQLETDVHFTLYKPNYLLKLAERFPEAKRLYYFDPDIIVKTRWSYFESWVNSGVALCEDVSSPLLETDPTRQLWREDFPKMESRAKDPVYVNGGFIGIKVEDLSFLRLWKEVQDKIIPKLGTVDFSAGDRSDPYFIFDQDLLNITKELTDIPLIITDKSQMDFPDGGFIMSHAIGQPKPWQKNFLADLVLKGHRPSKTDKIYFQHTYRPLDVYSKHSLSRRLKLANLSAARLLSRVIAS